MMIMLFVLRFHRVYSPLSFPYHTTKHAFCHITLMKTYGICAMHVFSSTKNTEAGIFHPSPVSDLPVSMIHSHGHTHDHRSLKELQEQHKSIRQNSFNHLILIQKKCSAYAEHPSFLKYTCNQPWNKIADNTHNNGRYTNTTDNSRKRLFNLDVQ